MNVSRRDAAHCDNPFALDREHPVVAVAAGIDAAANTRAALRAFDLGPAAGKRVLLKPNAGRVSPPGSGVCTDPRVVAAAIDAFMQAGATVAVGESPITGVCAHEALQATGIAAVARARGVALIDLDARPPVSLRVADGLAVKTLKVCADVFDFDIIVSIPVMKIHMHTGVTLSVKNMKGCLWRRSKVDLHMLPPIEGYAEKSLDIAIADMATVLRPHFSIIDGTIGMEGLGPSAGTPRALGVIVAGADSLAADAVACELMGRRAVDIAHLRMASRRGCGIIDIDRIAVSPPQWRQHACSFAAAPDNLSLEFPNVVVHDRNSCSACQSSVLMFLKRHSRQLFDYLGDDAPVHIAIGKGHAEVPERTLCIGNCMARHKKRGIFVPGCPPVASSIVSAIEAWYLRKR